MSQLGGLSEALFYLDGSGKRRPTLGIVAMEANPLQIEYLNSPQNLTEGT